MTTGIVCAVEGCRRLRLADRRICSRHVYAQLRDRPPVPRPVRSCPVCGAPAGVGFHSYCSTEHLLAGPRETP